MILDLFKATFFNTSHTNDGNMVKRKQAQQLKAQSVNKTHTVQMLHRRDERQGTNETDKKVHRKKAKSAPSTNIKLIKPRFKQNKNNLRVVHAFEQLHRFGIVNKCLICAQIQALIAAKRKQETLPSFFL